ncbi:hypothetical protein BDP27DRAFT_1336033 [Rhodocollybia butyracea]|uniref:Uncharacterized protein n=1 Tax=Rhodocollybia butyracea TaxID=206335 RepID=A0A9P5PGA8_9AGAR|nr:hypothetical protein BDP27DRAFT_1336033 [Rhodocollybia butyracea]
MPPTTRFLKAVLKNAKSRDALMKAIMDNTKLHEFGLQVGASQSMVADFPNAIAITRTEFNASAHIPRAVEKQLDPPLGTKGFSNQIYKVDGTNWTLDVYAYRHANSNNVTLIVLHSGFSEAIMTSFVLWTTPESASQFQYPVTYDSQLDDDRYSYTIDSTYSINMIGPDGKNPIVFKAIYRETFISQFMAGGIGQGNGPTYLSFAQLSGQTYGMSVFNASFEVGTSIFIELLQDCIGSGTYTGRVEVMV